jgi:hypothetical protein
MTNPLEGLLVDADEVNLDLLASGLRPYVAIDSKTGALHFRPDYSSLQARNKVLVCLLGQKASALLGKTESEVSTPKAVEVATGLPGGTVRGKLLELKNARLITADGPGKYRVAPHQLGRALEEVGAKMNGLA